MRGPTPVLTPTTPVGYTQSSTRNNPPEGRTQTMASTRTINFTAPDGVTPMSVNVSAKRHVSALRVLDFGQTDNGRWLTSIHKTVLAAIKGPNQTPMWNSMPRYVLVIDDNDQPGEGGWMCVS